MSTIIPKGEVKEVVSDAVGGALYNISVDESSVVFARTQQEAERGHGRKVEPGYKGEIQTRQGGESVWVKALDGEAAVTVKRSGFTLRLFPRRETIPPSEKSTADGTLERSGGAVSLDTSATATKQLIPGPTNNTDYHNPIWLTWTVTSGAVQAGEVSLKVEWKDSGGELKRYDEVVLGPNTNKITIPPEWEISSDEEVVATLRSHTTNNYTADVYAAYNHVDTNDFVN